MRHFVIALIATFAMAVMIAMLVIALRSNRRSTDQAAADSPTSSSPVQQADSEPQALESPPTMEANVTPTALPFTISVVYSPEYMIDLKGLEKLHPFDIAKYQKIYQALVDDGLLDGARDFEPEEISRDDLLLIHTEDYLDRLKERRNIASYLESEVLLMVPFSLDKAVLRPFRFATGGTLLAARQALQSGIGINIGGGYHHAKPDIGEGFCLYADVPIAIARLREESKIKRALVIDVDAHQGNGTAVCLADDADSFTFSMHQKDIYPIPKEHSDLDVELRAGDGDQQFMAALEEHIDFIFEESQPDICFIVGGCDPLADDPLAGLEMTPEGIRDRDAWIVLQCVQRNVPVVLTLSGGYSEQAWRSQYLSIKNLIQTHSLNGDP